MTTFKIVANELDLTKALGDRDAYILWTTLTSNGSCVRNPEKVEIQTRTFTHVDRTKPVELGDMLLLPPGDHGDFVYIKLAVMEGDEGSSKPRRVLGGLRERIDRSQLGKALVGGTLASLGVAASGAGKVMGLVITALTNAGDSLVLESEVSMTWADEGIYVHTTDISQLYTFGDKGFAFTAGDERGKAVLSLSVLPPAEPGPKIGDHVDWESGGVLQVGAGRVRKVEGGFVFVEGSDTGLPAGECVVVLPLAGSLEEVVATVTVNGIDVPGTLETFGNDWVHPKAWSELEDSPEARWEVDGDVFIGVVVDAKRGEDSGKWEATLSGSCDDGPQQSFKFSKLKKFKILSSERLELSHSSRTSA